jgi:hypothetical protein
MFSNLTYVSKIYLGNTLFYIKAISTIDRVNSR